jgi:hypothetical protein
VWSAISHAIPRELNKARIELLEFCAGKLNVYSRTAQALCALCLRSDRTATGQMLPDLARARIRWTRII